MYKVVLNNVAKESSTRSVLINDIVLEFVNGEAYTTDKALVDSILSEYKAHFTVTVEALNRQEIEVENEDEDLDLLEESDTPIVVSALPDNKKRRRRRRG